MRSSLDAALARSLEALHCLALRGGFVVRFFAMRALRELQRRAAD
jgi:hypothetical protein